MKTSANGRKFIEQWEEDGIAKLHPYDDGTGTLTIGFGHTSAAGPPSVHHGMVITAKEADDILSADLHSVENDVNRLVKVPINQNQFDALVSFHFNTGALARSNVLASINHNHFSQVTNDLMLWDHAGGRVMLGLVRRRRAEGHLFNSTLAGVSAVPQIPMPVPAISNPPQPSAAKASIQPETQSVTESATQSTTIAGGKTSSIESTTEATTKMVGGKSITESSSESTTQPGDVHSASETQSTTVTK